ncbi:hypothetical protein pdam_00004300 [Pocillopora damicornis]|uniref:Uncharacterized protein n=1 Tax=Pocillopora damicornis TaxID=46731 RepID=A0A3M6T8M5_POCDA|nr:hypothetical protein pdam_00004300 [Pocillopora damicornis]
MKFRATTSLNSRLQEMDQIVTMTVTYILIICEGPFVEKNCLDIKERDLSQGDGMYWFRFG